MAKGGIQMVLVPEYSDKKKEKSKLRYGFH
nr:NADH-plastoquinone oxidoreductase subunit K [Champereia manillana var. longistaminea]